MSFAMGADELASLAQFLKKLREATKETGVEISHYDRVTLKTSSGAEVMMAGSCDDDYQYAIEERDAS